mgnify:CR=1 FL=1
MYIIIKQIIMIDDNFKIIEKKVRKKKVEPNNTIMLIDSSYASFYRFYATQVWFSKAYAVEYETITNQDEYDWFSNDIFMDKYNKMYFRCFDKIRKTYGVKTENMVFAFDCPRPEIWRNEYMDGYKANRENDKHKKGNIGDVFKHTYSVIYPTLKTLHDIKTIKIFKAEADDIIAVIKKNIRKNNPEQNIVIVTNDYDYLQLADEYTVLINLKNKLITDKSKGSPEKDLLNKIICGDPSDSITGVFKKFGEKTLQKYYDAPELLQKKLDEDPETRKKYELNKTMIDFQYIPQDIQTDIMNIYKNIFNELKIQ